MTFVGLITKRGILIVEFANQKQLSGLDRRAAVIEAETLRLRPILMTTGAMVLGAVALATGADAENRLARYSRCLQSTAILVVGSRQSMLLNPV